MGQLSELTGKILYGALFAIVLPLLLLAWADRTRSVVTLPPVHSLSWGLAIAGAGVVLMALGMYALWRRGGGLPMNAFPPPRYVATGIYGVVSHPIYVGFSALCIGVAIATSSASGLWLVSPTVILASAALVLGYEVPDMHSRFGGAFPMQRLLPPNDSTPPTARERLRCYLTVLLPWLLLYEAFVALGIPRDASVGSLPFESQIPILPWTAIFYASAYLVVIAVPLLAPTRQALRQFSSRALLSMLLVFPIYLAVPLISPPRPFVTDTRLGHWLIFGRAHDSPAAAFPAYPVIWAFLAVEAITTERWQKWLGRAWALLVAASCLTTGMHSIADILAAFVIVWIVMRTDKLWSLLRRASEAIANSWHEWRAGPVRIINHGAYAAAGVFVGVGLIDTLLGPGKSAIPIAIYASGTICSALWAQWVEGSPALLRPLGFYGGVIGTNAAGILAAWYLHTNLWLVLAALAVAAPWIQGLGRLRCLVQGCCHGRPVDGAIGIRYFHPRSRVCRIAELRGIPIHPTPLYSLLWNVLVAVVVARLYLLHSTASLVGGVYLMLSGLGRFVEESYRGEPQTRIVAGLRLYQWMAIASVVIGAFVTTVTTAPQTPQPVLRVAALAPASVCALFAWIVTGVDFPESNRRFARLT